MQTILALYNAAPGFLQAIIVVFGAIATFFTTVAALVATVPHPRARAIAAGLIKLGADVVGLIKHLSAFLERRSITKSINGSLFVACALFALGCGILNPRPSTPCPGLYCLSVDLPGVPGSTKLCYDTDEARAAAKAQLERDGRRVQVLK